MYLMPSPDILQYVNLSLIDRDPQDVYNTAIAQLSANLPEWSPREGTTEVLLLEAMAMQVAEAIFAINRLPSAITEVLLSFYDITRDSGEPPTTTIRFEMSGTLGYSIPAGVSLVLELEGGLKPVTFITEEELVIPPGVSVGTVAATGDRFTDEANGVPANTLLQPLESLISVNYARLDSPVADGRQPESDIEYLTRGVQRFRRLSSTLMLPSHFEAAALENPAVERALTVDNYNPTLDPDRNGPVGQDAGHVAIAVYGNSELVSNTDKTALLDSIKPSMFAALQAHIIDPTITPVDVTASVMFDKGVDPALVTEDIEFAIEGFLNPMTWPWDNVVRRNELISLINNVPGVDFIAGLTAPATDITLTGVANLVDAGNITITGAV